MFNLSRVSSLDERYKSKYDSLADEICYLVTLLKDQSIDLEKF